MMMDKVNVMYLVDRVIVDMIDTIHMADMILVKKKLQHKVICDKNAYLLWNRIKPIEYTCFHTTVREKIT